jgi:L-seryl-tRNA(Ser) seleniumtransferase
MRKAAAPAADSEARRSIPSVERILSSAPFVSLASEFGRERVKEAVADDLDSLRRTGSRWDEPACVARVTALLGARTALSLRPLINATGVLIHTNLGRSPVGEGVWEEARPLASGYSNLEFDVDAGARGRRDEHLTALCRSLFGCQAALLTNNNAAAVLLLLSALSAKKEVVVSRGELVEIGGGFRVPEVIQQGGARLREVGTTNRTRVRDYAEAISRKTAAILRVHRSNFDIVGFTETPPVGELVELARAKRVPLLYDEGSGRVVDLARYGFSAEMTIGELIAAGVDAVTCSTDKLIGATQGGLIVGRADIVERCARHPLMRALRAGKESYAVIGATLRAFATGRQEELVPVYRMLATPLDELRRRGRELGEGTKANLIDSRAVLGGGTTPSESVPSVALALPGDAEAHQRRFAARPIPVVGRIADGLFTLDLRTVLPSDLPLLREALAETG